MESAKKGVYRLCTPCLKEWKIMKSDIYCMDCEANFCDNCFLFHKRIPNLADQHIILRNKEIDVWKNIPYKCKTHNKCYEFFCEDHSEVCCQVCVYLEHRRACHQVMICKNEIPGVWSFPERNGSIGISWTLLQTLPLKTLQEIVTNECNVIVENNDDEFDVDEEDVIYTDTGLNYYYNDPYERDWKLPPPKVLYNYVCSNVYCSIRTNTNVCFDCGSKCTYKGVETRRNKTLTLRE